MKRIIEVVKLMYKRLTTYDLYSCKYVDKTGNIYKTDTGLYPKFDFIKENIQYEDVQTKKYNAMAVLCEQEWRPRYLKWVSLFNQIDKRIELYYRDKDDLYCMTTIKYKDNSMSLKKQVDLHYKR